MTRLVAPGELERIRAFVNTLHIDAEQDDIERPAQLQAWLESHGLHDGKTRVTAKDVAFAREVRESIRALLRANAGEPLDSRAVETLDRAADECRVQLTFSREGAHLEPRASGARAAIGRLLAIVAAAMGEGTFERLKACREETCVWAFYDHSKNRSRTWCSMAVCGNRTKVRTYRKRQK